MSVKKAVARKAVKSTAKHTARGAGSKLKREPVRATTLLVLGGLLGGLAVWVLMRQRVSPTQARGSRPA